MLQKTTLFLCSLFLCAGAWGGEFYVAPGGNDANDGSKDAPFASLARAQSAVREAKSAADAQPWTVFLAEGTYTIAETLVFGSADSGTDANPVVYRGIPGKTIISGGLEVTGWTVQPDGVWSADLPDFGGQMLYFEQFFVNGQRAVRSRYPNEGFLQPEKVWEEFPMDRQTRRSEKPFTRQELTGKAGDLDFLKDVPQNELPWAQMVIHHNWDTTRRILLGFRADENVLEMKGRNMKSWNPWRTNSLYYLENVRTAFDAAGEWFYDGNAKKVLYRPRVGETPENVRCIVPRPGLAQLLIVQGTSQTEPVQNLRFENLQFCYSDTPRRPNMMAGIFDVAMTGDLNLPGPSQFEPNQAAAFTLAVVMVDDARRIVFDGCEFSHLGEYGLWFKNTSECKFLNGKLYDLGAGGLRVGGGRPHEDFGKVTSCEKNVIDNCLIQQGGRFHASAVGVWIGNNTIGNQLTHNDIGDFYYTGVSVGWNWGYAGVCFDNQIEFNRIHDIGQGALADMGGVYTLGTLRGTRVCNNVIYNVASFGYGGWGLYPDEGSEGLLMENNLVYDTMDGSFHQHYGRDNIIRNNIFARNRPNPQRDAPAHQVAATRVEDHRSFVFEHNIIYWNDGTSVGYNVDKVRADIRENLWWKTTGDVEFAGKTHAQWEESGKDVGGRVADPLFVDPERNDFRLREGSPALGVGFVPFDYSRAGLRK